MLNPKIPAPLTNFEALGEATTHNASTPYLSHRQRITPPPRLEGQNHLVKPFGMLKAEGTRTDMAVAGSFLLVLLICFLFIHKKAQQLVAGLGSKENTPQESCEWAEPRALYCVSRN